MCLLLAAFATLTSGFVHEGQEGSSGDGDIKHGEMLLQPDTNCLPRPLLFELLCRSSP